MKVAEVMTRNVELVLPDTSVREAATVMAEHDIGAVLVGTPDRLQGILTDRDIIVRLVVAGSDPASVNVGSIMSATLFSCAPDDGVAAAQHEMEERQVRRLAVIDGAGRLVGIITRSDIAARARRHTSASASASASARSSTA